MNYPYSPKYLRAEPLDPQAVADKQAQDLVQINRTRLMDEELSAMVRRNPNRKPEGHTVKQESGQNIIRHNDTPMLIMSGLLMIVTMAVSLAALLA